MARALKKFDNINLLRAFAALTVVVFHVIENAQWTTFPSSWPLNVFRLGWLGVDLFFTVSGFVIVYSGLILYRDAPARFAKGYWARRISRIVPLYVLTGALWIAFISEGFFAEPAREWAWQLFTHLTFTHNFFASTHGSINSVNWTLGVEMQFYLLVAILIRWIDRTPGWRLWLHCTLVAWAWRAGIWTVNADDGIPILFLRTTELPGLLDEFGAGIFLAKWVLDGRSSLRVPPVAWCVAALASGYAALETLGVYALHYWDLPAIVVFWRSGLSVALFCTLGAAISLPQVIAYQWLRPLDWLGEVSYGIYLWHMFAVQLVVLAWGYRQGEALAWVVGLTVLASALSWRYFENR